MIVLKTVQLVSCSSAAALSHSAFQYYLSEGVCGGVSGVSERCMGVV